MSILYWVQYVLSMALAGVCLAGCLYAIKVQAEADRFTLMICLALIAIAVKP
jgi:hypothetical protein